jgi:hypothetical protein
MIRWDSSFANLGKRLIKTPKISLSDTGLWADILGVEMERLKKDSTLLEQGLENFVVMELRKQASWSKRRVRLHHFRDAKDHEVDLVLEDRAGDIVGIEIKATASPSTGDFKGLARLRELAGARFKRGILLHTGAPAVPFGERLFALPMQCLWRTA